MSHSLPLVPFYYLRHGQTDWNKEQRIMGQTDIPLNETGFEQAHQAAQSLSKVPFTTIIASPLQRALKTAEIIAQASGKPIIIIEELKEVHLGALQGKHKGDGTDLLNWLRGAPVEQAELKADFVQRVMLGMHKALQHDGPILIVAHGGVYRVLQEIFQLPQEGLPNCQAVFHRPPVNGKGNWWIEGVEGS
jgi:broad specificity phosphatase PhoE